jgi:hypothetical protein
VCARAQVGYGDVQVLVYLSPGVPPVFADPIPVKIFLYLGKGSQGAVASFQIISVPDETKDLVKNNQIISDNGRLAFSLNVLNDPVGPYGYKLVLPSGAIGSLRVAIPLVHVTNTGLTLKKKKTTCVRRSRGRCVKKKTTRKVIFWFNQPPCPSSGQFSFQAFYAYEDGTTSTVSRQTPCPQFKS